jgi:DNA gyrase/topoisomerase IV subunit A
VPEHWRLGVVEWSVLEAMDHLGLRPDHPHRKCASIVGRVAE